MNKVLTLTIMMLSLHSYGQIGQATTIVGQMLSSREKPDLQGNVVFSGQIYYPLGISSIISDSKTIVPPVVLSAEYGIYKNVTLGLIGGYSASQSKDYLSGGISSYDLLSVAQQLVCDTDQGLAAALGIDCSTELTNQEKYTNRVHNYLIGLQGRYCVVGNKKMNWFLGMKAGYKLSKQRQIGNTQIQVIDDITKLLSNANKFFFASTLGANIYVDKQNTMSLTPEIGYSYGFGDGISLGTKSVLLGVGFNYHLRHKTRD